MSSPAVELAQVGRRFGERAVLDGVSLEVQPGELLALVGASGSGKSTLLHIMGGLDAEYSGSARLYGRELAAEGDDTRSALRNEVVGFVFQAFHLLEHLSVLENVQIPFWLARRTPPDAAARAAEALGFVGLAGRAAESVKPLSGGERQRVAIARALAARPRLLLADEPTGNLDQETGRGMLELLDRYRQGAERAAVVVATHDTRLAERADRVLALEHGKLVERAP